MRIGVDESGKGDYFGYLVTAAVAVGEKEEKTLRKMGVRDSKKLTDATTRKLAPVIKKRCKHEIVKISPKRYNSLYKKFNSLNKLLAWTHARAIENLLAKADCDLIIIDRFADERVLRRALFERSRKIRIEQKVHAESDIAVAAASVIARYEFLRTLRVLSRTVGYSLPKGSTHVKEALKFLREKYGEEMLSEVAKLHFKITRQSSH